MTIGIIDVDSHRFPNLPLMKISAYHKRHGDHIDFCVPISRYDVVYQSKVFTEEYTADIDFTPMADVVVKGGTGYGLDNALPDEIEHIYPDYSLYGISDTAYGFLTRGCPRDCSFCIVSQKEGCISRKVAELGEFWSGQKNIRLLDANILSCGKHLEIMEELVKSKSNIDFTQGLDIRLTDAPEIELLNRMRLKEIHFAWDNPYDELEERFAHYSEKTTHRPHGHFGTVYCLTNHGSTFEQDLYRVEVLRNLGFQPYIMIFDKPHSQKRLRNLQRYVNNKIIFNSCSFDEYKSTYEEE